MIYIYVSSCKAIRFRCKVTKTNLAKRVIDDSRSGELEEYNRYAEFTLEKKYSGDCLSYDLLRENGLNNRLQGAIKVKTE